MDDIDANTYIPTIPLHRHWIPIATRKSNEEARTMAAVWAHQTFTDLETSGRKLLINGAVAVIKFGMCVTANDVEDGCWISIHKATFDAATFKDKLEPIISKENEEFAVKVIIATKINWWLTQHPIKSHCMHEYLRNILISKYETISHDIITAVNIIGCWASTIKVLSLAGIQNLKRIGDAAPPAMSTISLSDVEQHKFEELPAGTHKVYVVYEAAVLLIQSPLLQICPRSAEFVTISEIKKTVLSSPAEYHNAAIYLTGRPKKSSLVNSCDKYLGRLRSFILRIFPKSNLAKSPFLNIRRFPTYRDYSFAFDMALKEYARPLSGVSMAAFFKNIRSSNLGLDNLPNDEAIARLEQEFGCKMQNIKLFV